jgi:hypothetical protein
MRVNLLSRVTKSARFKPPASIIGRAPRFRVQFKAFKAIGRVRSSQELAGVGGTSSPANRPCGLFLEPRSSRMSHCRT